MFPVVYNGVLMFGTARKPSVWTVIIIPRNIREIYERKDFMKKKVILFVLLSLIAIGSVFAESLQCRDPADGKITINVMGDSIVALYSGKSAQSFEVVCLLKDGTTQYITFNFPKTTKDATRRLNKQARGPIEKVTNCSFNSVY